MAAVPKPGSSKDSPDMQEIIPRSAPEKLHIIRHFANRVRNKANKGFLPKKHFKDLTGLHPEHLPAISRLSFSDNIKIDTVELNRIELYKTWVDMCKKTLSLPTTEQLFWSLRVKDVPIYMDIGHFRTWLYNNGFMWEQCPNGKLAVTEKKEVRYERYLYLQKLARYRSENKQIVFIDHCVFNCNGRRVTSEESYEASKNNDETYHRAIFVASKIGLHCLQFVERYIEKVFLEWITQEFLMFVGTPSVVVLSYDKHCCEEVVNVPNLDSTKRDLCKWLDYFNVPYDPEMTKVTLHDLIQKYTDLSEKVYVVDTILKANGHTVLRLPNSIRKLTSATMFLDMLDLNMKMRFSHETNVSPERIRESIHEFSMDFSYYDTAGAWNHIQSQEESISSLDVSIDKLLCSIIKEQLIFVPNRSDG
ncbi:hypothetical protein HW555_005248 [Spodoptera exigua]|uniref:Uncharacterized protein n=1 Tax=Spodoptera exigua TaxID=7107 RepID=A0A835GLK7_SPOEX|nr:hypothetical protein HW555_005248 [Spodoptera exigua]